MLIHNAVLTGSLVLPTLLPLTGSLTMTGSMGINVPNPSVYGGVGLAVSGAVANSIARVAMVALGISNGLNIGDDGTDAVIGPLNSGTKTHILSRAGGVYTRALTVDSAGSVGIGTTAPVTLNGADANLTIYAGQDSSLTLKDSVENWEFYCNDDLYITTGSITNTPTMTFKRVTGYVGIGTSNPTHTLTVFNSGSSYIKVHGDFGIAYLGMETADDSCRLVTAQATNFQFYTNNVERVRIGATTDQYDLMIGGTSVLHPATNRGSVSVNGASSAIYSLGVGGVAKGYLYHGGTIMYIENSGGSVQVIAGGAGGVVLSSGATSWTSASDIRLKNINSNIENAVEKLSTLRTVNFSWKSDDTNKENLGLIAQDVEAVFPQVIEKNQLPSKPDQEQTDETEYLGVKYTELIPVLVKAIQELKAENDALTTRITALEN